MGLRNEVFNFNFRQNKFIFGAVKITSMRVIAFSLFLLFFFGCSQNRDLSPIISEVKKEFAPDKRVAIFNIEATVNGGNATLEGESNLPEAVNSLIAKLKAQNLDIRNNIKMLPDEALGGHYFGVVTLSACNIRSKGKHSAELATQATLGTPLTVYKKEGSWYYVQTPDGYLGWLDDGGFQLMDKRAFDVWQEKAKVIYLPDFGFARSTPDADAHPVSDLLSGNILAKRGDAKAGWMPIEFPDGRKAFVPESEVMDLSQWLDTRSTNPDSILQTAFRYMGRPYLWGGTSGKALDCSGFTKTVFFQHGMIIPRDASQQVHAGIAVPVDTTLKGLERGDFLFFGKKREDGSNRITHVAMYLGNGKIIHETGRVKVQSLRRGDPDFAEDRLNTLLEARRLHVTPNDHGVQQIRKSKYLE